MKKSDFKKLEVTLENGVKLTFYHNLPETWGMNIEAALTNWEVRTNKYTVKSFQEYVANKNVGHQILTEEEYQKLQ